MTTRWLAAAVLLAASVAPAAGQDRLVLRDTKVVAGAVAVSADGLAVDQGGGKTVTVGWDEVQAGTVGGGRQAEFERMLTAVGDPLFRVRLRLKAGDFGELLDPAEKLFPLYKDRGTPVAAAVAQATALARLAANRREAAVEPFLCAAALKAKAGVTPDPRFAVAGGKAVAAAGAYGTWAELPPVWFDAAAAKAALPAVAARVKAWPGGKAPPGVLLYAATLALAAADPVAEEYEKEMGAAGSDWWPVFAAQREAAAGPAGPAAAKLETKLDALREPAKMVGTYWLGVGHARATDPAGKKRGAVWLLHLPALYADAAPDVAAAGLYHAARVMDEVKDARAAVALRSELLTGFRPTYHAARLLAETAPAKTDDPPPPAKP